MYAQLHNTVRAQRARPLLTGRDISGNAMPAFYSQLLAYFDSHASTPKSIGDTAVQFYLLNHGVALIDNESAPDQALDPARSALYAQYHLAVGRIGVRMVYDIVFMLTAMASTTHPDGYHLDMVESSYGAPARAFIEGLVGSTGNVSFWIPQYAKLKPVLIQARSSAQGVSLGAGLRALGYILDIRQKELSYGPLWRDVARVASAFFEGSKSLETTIDTAFTFCHCNGSFFEKGKLFSPVGNELFKALDVQRSGQIPQYVHEGKSALASQADTRALHLAFAKIFPSVFNAKMDWSLVKEITRNQLIFTQKYQQHWNAGAIGLGAPAEPPKPKIFAPIDEAGYLTLTKGL